MTIVVMAGRYYIPFADGFKEINKAEAMYLYEQGYFTTQEVENYEHD